MISFRRSDLLEQFVPESGHEIVFDFHWQKLGNGSHKFYFIIYNYDNVGTDACRRALQYMNAHGFETPYSTNKFDANKVTFQGCSGEFDDREMGRIHNVIDTYQEQMQAAGWMAKVKEDHVYRKGTEGSRYIVFFTVEKIEAP